MRIVALAIAGLLVLAGAALWVQSRADGGTPAELAAVEEWAGEDAPDPLAIPAGTRPLGGSRVPALPTVATQTKEQRRFARYDRDRDGIIGRDEMLGSRVRAFRQLDTNGDSFLSFQEWSIATARRFDGADRDRSGTLTPPEFATTAPKPAPKAKCRC